jgi:hypothetical protein
MVSLLAFQKCITSLLSFYYTKYRSIIQPVQATLFQKFPRRAMMFSAEDGIITATYPSRKGKKFRKTNNNMKYFRPSDAAPLPSPCTMPGLVLSS